MDIVAFDTETHLFGPGSMAPEIVCLSWATQTSSGLETGLGIEAWLRGHLSYPQLVGHVVAFDAAVILANFPRLWEPLWRAYAEGRIVCTAVRERLLDISTGQLRGKGYSLGELAKLRLNKAVPKGSDTYRLRYAELDGVPLSDWPSEAISYAVGDAETALALYLEQEARAREMGYSIPTQFDDSRADFALRLLSVWGIETDPARVSALWERTLDRMEGLLPELEVAGLVELPVRSGTLFSEARTGRRPIPEAKKRLGKIRELVAAHYPGGCPPQTPTGLIQVDKDVIRECDHAPLQKLSEFSSLQKTASTYLEKLFLPVIHARFDAVGGASNRTTSSGPNLQNQPRLPGIRECFRARAGRVFLACDFDAQEMRTLAQSCVDLVGKSHLAERFREDRHFDPHLEFAAALAKIPLEDAKRLKAAGDPHIKELRQQAKAANFGYPGGLGAKTFCAYAKGYGLTLTLDDSRQLKARWFEQWPEMAEYFDHIENTVGRGGEGVQTIPRSGFCRGGCGYSDCANGYFQTLAAHASKEALFQVSKRCYTDRGSALYGARPVLFIHDEIILEVLEEVGHEAAEELEHVMVWAMEKWTPDVPASASATLMRRWSKRAEATYRDGRLVPWEA